MDEAGAAETGGSASWPGHLQLVAQPICLGLLAVQSRLFPVVDHSLAIGYRPGLGGGGPIGAGALAIGGSTHRDLRASGVRRGGAERCQRAIAQGRGPIALERRQIAGVGNRVTTGSRGDASRDSATSLARPPLAKFTRERVRSGVLTVEKSTVAGELVQVGRGLVAVRRGLVAVRCALIAV